MTKFGAPPAHTHFGAVVIERGVVTHVDRVKHTVNVVTPTGRTYEGIPIQGHNLGGEGQGSYSLPDVNAAVMLCKPSDAGAPFVMGSANLFTQMEEGDEQEDPTDFRMNRPVINEGDTVVAYSSDGAYIIVRKGGAIEIASTQASSIMLLPLENLFRAIFQNFELLTPGGHIKFNTRRSEDNRPVEFNMQIKEFAGGNPLIEVGFGRIAAEDNEMVVQGAIGEVVARLLINDRVRLWVDKSGNIQSYVHGASTHSYNGPHVAFYQTSCVEEVRGMFKAKYGEEHKTVVANQTEEVGGDATKTYKNLTEIITGKYVRQVGNVVEDIKGAIQRTILGWKETIINSYEQTVGGGKVTTVGEAFHISVVGRHTIKVINRELDGNAFELSIINGDLVIHDILGNVVIGAGPSQTVPLAKVKITPTGGVKISSTTNQAAMEVNTTGVKISTPAGSLEVDNVGTVSLGPVTGAPGAVVTTLTHPVCYVTGAPILGCASVSARGIPSPAATPGTFVPSVS